MGLWDWLWGKGRESESEPPAAVGLGELGDDSPHVMVDRGDGALMIMDRDMYDYMYGNKTGPDPSQRDLDEMLPKVDRVRAIAGGIFRGRAMGFEIVLETSDVEALAALRRALRIVEDPRTFSHCGCLGGPVLELYSDQDLVAAIGLQHGRAIRWARWKHDAALCDGQALNDWLIRHGVESEFLDALLHNQYGGNGFTAMGFQWGGSEPLSRAEQQVRLAELSRANGGDPTEALARCRKVIDEEPGLAVAHAVRGFIHHDVGDPAGCVEDCNEAIRLGLRVDMVFFIRAVSLDNVGRPHEALADCTTALEINPRYTSALNSRGVIGCRLGLWDQALADLNEAIRLEPGWGLAYLNRSNVHHERGDLDAGIADCDRVLEITGKSKAPVDRSLRGMALFQRGRFFRRKGDRARAEADFREALRCDPNLEERVRMEEDGSERSY